MLRNVLPNLSHGLANIKVGGKQLVVLACLPVSESRQLLGNSLEKADNDTHGCGFHVMAELVNGRDILRSRLAKFNCWGYWGHIPGHDNGSQTASPPKQRGE